MWPWKVVGIKDNWNKHKTLVVEIGNTMYLNPNGPHSPSKLATLIIWMEN